MINKQIRLVALFSFMLFVVACGTMNVGLVPPEKMAPKELATYAMKIYNAQYDDYMAKATQPNLSLAEKDILKVKKASLETSWPIIRTFVWYVDQNQSPPTDLQQQLLTWINSVRY